MHPDAIIIHHSLTPDGATVSWQAIRTYHTSYRRNGKIVTPEAARDMMARGLTVEKPWRAIGYHFGIELVNNRYEILGGRSMTEPGAHCLDRGMNSHSLGICLVGNFDLAPPPQLQWDGAVDLVRSLMDIWKIKAERVFGHNEMAAYKSCPGKRFDMNRFRQNLRGW